MVIKYQDSRGIFILMEQGKSEPITTKAQCPSPGTRSRRWHGRDTYLDDTWVLIHTRGTPGRGLEMRKVPVQFSQTGKDIGKIISPSLGLCLDGLSRVCPPCVNRYLPSLLATDPCRAGETHGQHPASVAGQKRADKRVPIQRCTASGCT